MIKHMNLGDASYDIVLEYGLLRFAWELLHLRRKVLLVTDEGVPQQYASIIASQCGDPYIYTVPSGEGSKSLPTLEKLLSEMLSHGFTRSDCVVAVGGGVVGDLAGFAASVYMRGIDFYNIPTTVLSQVDSSIGGKTAVNLDGVKNIVGSFWQPKKVLIDLNTLKTLPKRQIAAGLAEAVKAGLIADEGLFAMFESAAGPQRKAENISASADPSAGAGESPLLDPFKSSAIYLDLIGAALEVKKTVVEKDEREGGLRKILNFGHTIGHGIESVTGLPHGECVALGMLPMCSPAVRSRLLPVLESLGLPTKVKANPEAVCAAILHDKKISLGNVSVILVDSPGSCRMEAVPPESLKEAVASVVEM